MREWPDSRKIAITSASERLDVDRLDVGARHHHVLDAHVAELQDGAEHGALVGG